MIIFRPDCFSINFGFAAHDFPDFLTHTILVTSSLAAA